MLLSNEKIQKYKKPINEFVRYLSLKWEVYLLLCHYERVKSI